MPKGCIGVDCINLNGSEFALLKLGESWKLDLKWKINPTLWSICMGVFKLITEVTERRWFGLCYWSVLLGFIPQRKSLGCLPSEVVFLKNTTSCQRGAASSALGASLLHLHQELLWILLSGSRQLPLGEPLVRRETSLDFIAATVKIPGHLFSPRVLVEGCYSMLTVWGLPYFFFVCSRNLRTNEADPSVCVLPLIITLNNGWWYFQTAAAVVCVSTCIYMVQAARGTSLVLLLSASRMLSGIYPGLCWEKGQIRLPCKLVSKPIRWFQSLQAGLKTGLTPTRVHTLETLACSEWRALCACVTTQLESRLTATVREEWAKPLAAAESRWKMLSSRYRGVKFLTDSSVMAPNLTVLLKCKFKKLGTALCFTPGFTGNSMRLYLPCPW